jgi:hypothetical protein
MDKSIKLYETQCNISWSENGIVRTQKLCVRLQSIRGKYLNENLSNTVWDHADDVCEKMKLFVKETKFSEKTLGSYSRLRRSCTRFTHPQTDTNDGESKSD